MIFKILYILNKLHKTEVLKSMFLVFNGLGENTLSYELVVDYVRSSL